MNSTTKKTSPGQASKLVERRLPDLNNTPDARTSYTYEGSVRLEIVVERDSSLRRRGLHAPFKTTVGWGSRNALTAEEATEFSEALQEGLVLAEAETARRNSLDAEPRSKPKMRPTAV